MNKQNIFWAIPGVAVSVAIIYLVYYVFVKQVRDIRQSQGTKVPVNEDFLDPNTNYDAIVLQMWNVIDGITDSVQQKSQVIDLWLSKNDEEFKHLCNLYNKRYCKGSDTIRTHLEGEWVVWPWKLSAFTKRMDSLSLA